MAEAYKEQLHSARAGLSYLKHRVAILTKNQVYTGSGMQTENWTEPGFRLYGSGDNLDKNIWTVASREPVNTSSHDHE